MTLDGTRVDAWRLARQHLLDADATDLGSVATDLVGIQAQLLSAAELSLNIRVTGTTPETVRDAVCDRRLVRMWAMRGTLHLLTARDALMLRSAMQPMLERALMTGSAHGKKLTGLDLEALVAAGRALVVLSGGSKVDDDTVLQNTRDVMQAGGSGVIFGRNVWQREWNEALEIIGQIKETLLSSVSRTP